MRFLVTIAIINSLLVLSQRMVMCKAYIKKNAKTNVLLRFFFSITVVFVFCLLLNNPLIAQPCTGGTPSYSINLTGNNDSIWTSPNVSRAGNCCGTSNSNCIEFNVTLDPNSRGIRIDTISGAIPSGSYYKVACGSPQSFGQPVCLNGTGPFRITFCKSGNISNVYRITAIPKPIVTITPDNPTVCYGAGTNVTLTANYSGGVLPYYYTWNNGDTSRIKTVGSGTYHIAVTDSLGCIVARDTSIVKA